MRVKMPMRRVGALARSRFTEACGAVYHESAHFTGERMSQGRVIIKDNRQPEPTPQTLTRYSPVESLPAPARYPYPHCGGLAYLPARLVAYSAAFVHTPLGLCQGKPMSNAESLHAAGPLFCSLLSFRRALPLSFVRLREIQFIAALGDPQASCVA